jgi:hypothetical protein
MALLFVGGPSRDVAFTMEKLSLEKFHFGYAPRRLFALIQKSLDVTITRARISYQCIVMLKLCCGVVLGQGAGLALGTTFSRLSTTQLSSFFILSIFVRIAESNHLYAVVTQLEYTTVRRAGAEF